MVVDGDRRAAEMLHTFFRLMELECSLVEPRNDAVPTIRRARADVLILDLDLPDLRALEIARELRTLEPHLAVVFLTADEALTSHGADAAATGAAATAREDAPVLRKPGARFEELLRLFEVILAM
ncbi:MAG TPA: response regulator [Thermoanaerobaculia bacterium]